jgi:hypothetical protein
MSRRDWLVLSPVAVTYLVIAYQMWSNTHLFWPALQNTMFYWGIVSAVLSGTYSILRIVSRSNGLNYNGPQLVIPQGIFIILVFLCSLAYALIRRYGF